MSFLMDTCRTDEELQEEKELRQAVEQLVETAAASVWSSIVADVKALCAPIRIWLELLFPLLVEYHQDPGRIGQDLSHLALYLFVCALAFFLLAPSITENRRKKNHQRSSSAALLVTPQTTINAGGRYYPSPSFSSPASPYYHDNEYQYWNHDDTGFLFHTSDSDYGGSSEHQWKEEETDEERFERIWATRVAHTEYHRLVLPPVCRRVHAKERQQLARAKQQQEKQQQRERKQQQKLQRSKARRERSETSIVSTATSPGDDNRSKEGNDYDDNPVKRLQCYMRNVLSLIRSILSFDYAAAGWTLLSWLQGIQRYRKINHNSSDNNMNINSSHHIHHHNEDEEEDDVGNDQQQQQDDDNTTTCDLSVSSSHHDFSDATRLPRTTSRPLLTAPQQPLLATTVEKDGEEEEEKKQESSSHSQQNQQRQQQQEEDLSSSVDESSWRDLTQQDVPEEDDDIDDILDENDNNEAPLTAVSPLLEIPKSQLLPRPENFSLSKPDVNKRTWNGTISSATSETTAVDESPVSTEFYTTDHQRSQTYFFETAHSQASLKRLMADGATPDKNGYILGDELLPDSRYTPLLVFVNSRSGPQQGHLLITQLRRLLNPIQVWDLADGDPQPILESFCTLTRLRILVCGGDGTVSWIISTLERMKLQRKWPPIAILPLGTGNDLARIHGWGGGYNNESLIGILKQISESYISMLDLWELTIVDKKRKKKEVKNFFNYLGVGADAQAALQVHYLRESRPQWFFSRMVNKLWYGVFGAEDIIKASSVHVRKEIKLIADGVEIPLPPDSQGIILLNIDSYAGGVPLWSHGAKPEGPVLLPPLFHHGLHHQQPSRHPPRRSFSMGEFSRSPLRRSTSLDSLDDAKLQLTDEERHARVTACDRPSSCQDGLLEVVSIRGAFHLGQIKVGLSNAQRLCQCREATIIIRNKVAVQVDGEPWRQRECTLRIQRKKETAAMLHRSADDGGVETEMSKLLEWAEERHLIDSQVHSILLKEFSRRIENKTRERRVRPKDNNIMSTLKRAISSKNVQAMPVHGGIAF